MSLIYDKELVYIVTSNIVQYMSYKIFQQAKCFLFINLLYLIWIFTNNKNI